MLGLESEPLHPLNLFGLRGTMIELRPGWYCGKKEGHAIVIERRSPLPHGRVNSIEDMVRIWYFGYFGSGACS